MEVGVFSVEVLEASRVRGTNSVTRWAGLEESLASASKSQVAYFTDILPLIRATHAKVRIFQFVQSPGDTVFVPSGWWFAALTLEDCVAVSQAFCSHSNFAKVRDDTERVWL